MFKLILGVHLIIGFLLWIYLIYRCSHIYVRGYYHLRTKYKFPIYWEILNERFYNICDCDFDEQKKMWGEGIGASLIIALVGGLWWPIVYHSYVGIQKLLMLINIKNLLYSICLSKEEKIQIALGTIEEPKE
jgi:hypothetical protein